MNIPFVDLKLQYKEIQSEIENAIFMGWYREAYNV